MIGATLAHFRITAKLGEGGMGEVYRAEDTKLGREVAIKVLPEAVSQDPERLARFEREAKVLAALNHTNIAAIYSLESSVVSHQLSDEDQSSVISRQSSARSGEPATAREGGTENWKLTTDDREVGREVAFLVMELAEGEDLRERIERGPIPVDEAVRLALQIAEALEAAHDKGIIHRDLKPGNVKVTRDGQVKVLDFGLAKALEVEGEAVDMANSPTLTAAATQAGIIMGTAGYMSPEQASGEAADRRADIWSFGVVLAEMLTGRRQFEGKTVSHVLAAVLKEDPDWSRFPSDTPPPILDLMQHCMRKEPKQRLQAIGDARVQLQDYLENPADSQTAALGAVSSPAPTWRRTLPWALFALTTIALIAALSMTGDDSAAPIPVVRSEILAPTETSYYLNSWNPGPLAVSPDGSKLAFSAQDDSGVVQLYVRPVASNQAVALPGTEGAAYPFWSPDSRWIAFFSEIDDTLKKIDTAGGPPVTVSDAANGKGGSWNRDGVILLVPQADTVIYRVPSAGGDPAPVTELAEGRHNSHRHPRFLPDGKHFLYLARAGSSGENTVMLGSLDGSIDRELVSSPAQADYASGHLLFARGDTLMTQPFDVDRLVLNGEAMPLVEKIMVLPDAAVAIFSASQSGLLAYQTGEVVLGTRLELRDRQGEILHQIGEPVVFGQMALSPDGKIVAAVHYDSAGLSDLWLTEIDTGLRNRFTFESGANLWMAWHPDGKGLFFSSTSGAGSNLYRKDVGSAGEMEALFESDRTRLPCSVSPDGQSVLIWEVIPGTGSDIWTWSLADGGEPRPFRQTEADERCGSFSPDGRWVAYYSTEVGQRRSQVYVTPFPGPGRRWQISTNGGLYPQWAADGRELIYTEPNGQLVAVEVNPGEDTIHVGQAQPLFRIHPPQPDGPNFALTPDGERILLWTNPRDQADTVLNLVVNWPAMLERR